MQQLRIEGDGGIETTSVSSQRAQEKLAEQRAPSLALPPQEIPNGDGDHFRQPLRVVMPRRGPDETRSRGIIEPVRKERFQSVVDAPGHLGDEPVIVEDVSVAMEFGPCSAPRRAAVDIPFHLARALPHGARRSERMQLLVVGQGPESELHPERTNPDERFHRVGDKSRGTPPVAERFNLDILRIATGAFAAEPHGPTEAATTGAAVPHQEDEQVVALVETDAEPHPGRGSILLAGLGTEPMRRHRLVFEPGVARDLGARCRPA